MTSAEVLRTWGGGQVSKRQACRCPVSMCVGARVLSLACAAACALACTTLIAGTAATTDGSAMASHSNDGEGNTDPRIVRVPARTFPEGSLRPVYYSPESYPRYVGYERKVEQYYPRDSYNFTEFEPLGYIPQVTQTYAYFEETYGIINEHQVAIGESTCSAVFATHALNHGGKALLSVDQLSQLALERTTSAREAVTVMGALAEEYGFYGPSGSFEGSGESLMVTDPLEAFIFHILPDPTGESAIWVAARVPDHAVCVVANMFVVREVDLEDTFNFVGSTNMWEIAEEQGLWTPDQPKDFTKTFSDGEYAHKYYSGRRMWGAYRLLAPSLGLSASYDNLKEDAPYPVCTAPDELVSPHTFMNIHRDWYNGTSYSTGVGLAGGAFGTPDRYSGGTGEAQVQGNWERTITLFRTSDSYVTQSRSWLPNEVGGVVWFGPGAAHATVYTPFVVSMESLPKSYTDGWQGQFSWNSAFWAHRSVVNLAQTKFSYLYDDINTAQLALEQASQLLLDSATTEVDLTALFTLNAEAVVSAWWKLFETLLFKYADGWINTYVDGNFKYAATGYPAWWLESVGYTDGPPPVDSEDGTKMNQKPHHNTCASLKECVYMCPDTAQLKTCTSACLDACHD